LEDFPWWSAPEGTRDKFFTVTTLDEMSARQLRESHSVDLDFISSTTPRASG
jgi:hypothetical protein